MTYCFNAIIKDPGQPNDPAPTLDILDALQMIADRYGVHHVRISAQPFRLHREGLSQGTAGSGEKCKLMPQICPEFGQVNTSATGIMCVWKPSI